MAENNSQDIRPPTDDERQPLPDRTPSPKRLTREFLDTNFNKADLQKQCRELGCTKIWVTKNELIDMILQKSNTVTPDPDDANDKSGIDILKLALDIESIKAKLHTKDMEIDILNEEVKTAYETITTLQQRVEHLEQKLSSNTRGHFQATNNKPPQLEPQPQPQPHCLLLGDTNLRRVLRSDLGNNCSVKTIYGANVDLLRSWIDEKLDRYPSECVIYGGIYDILEESTSEKILDNLGSLISILKEKNNEMKIFVCQVVPLAMPGQFGDQVKAYNEQLVKWGDTNGITVIKTPSHFHLSNGDLDDMCFEGEECSSVFNRLGVIRLLGAIEAQCPEFRLCNNWNVIKKDSRRFMRFPNQYPPRQPPRHHEPPTTWQAPPGSRTTSRLPANPAPHDTAPHRHWGSHRHQTTASRPGTNGTNGSWTHIERRGLQAHDGDEASRSVSPTHLQPGGHYQHDSRYTPHHPSPQYGCYKCGEFNHRQATCRFDHRLRCGHCHQLGHKGRLCQNPNV